jgi:hypothetical protein
MPEKEVQKSYQTFHAHSSGSNFTFAFYRVYKRQAKNRFRVRVVQLADFDNSNDGIPLMYVVQGGLMGSTSVISHVSTAPGSLKSNDFVLGVTSRNQFNTALTTSTGTIQTSPIEFYTDEIKVSPFTIRYYDLATGSYGSSDLVSLVVTFEITELEEY